MKIKTVAKNVVAATTMGVLSFPTAGFLGLGLLGKKTNNGTLQGVAAYGMGKCVGITMSAIFWANSDD